MELSKFLEQDIVDFLDKVAAEQRDKKGLLRSEEFTLFNVDRDYAEEAEKALEDHNPGKAKGIFKELKEAYDELEGREEEQEKVREILKEVYAKIKKSSEDETQLEDDLKEVGLMGEEKAKDEEDLTPEEKELEKADKEMEEVVGRLNGALEQRDLDKAIQGYHDLKEKFKDYPEHDQQRKVRWYNHVLGTYEMIRRLKQKHHAAEKEQKHRTEEAEQKEAKRQAAEEAARKRQEEEAKRQEAEKKATEERKRKQQQDAKQAVRAVLLSLDQNDHHKITQLLVTAKHKVAGLPHDPQKATLEQILSTATHRLEFLKRNAERERRAAEERKRKEAEAAAKRKEQAQQEAALAKTAAQAKNRQRTAEDKQNAEKLYRQAVKHQHEGEDEKAKEAYRKVLELNPDHLPARIRLQDLEDAHEKGEAA